MSEIWPESHNRYGVNFTIWERESSPLATNEVGLSTRIVGRLFTQVKHRRLLAECLASPRQSRTVARLAREHHIKFSKLAAAVRRAREREFLANTTGIAAANR